jgi:hypothetical protein
MATNVTVFPVEGQAIIYFQDGSSEVLEPQLSHSFQIPDSGFCTVSDAPADEDTETGEKFIAMMKAFWNKLWNEVQEGRPGAGEPEVTPV